MKSFAAFIVLASLTACGENSLPPLASSTKVSSQSSATATLGFSPAKDVVALGQTYTVSPVGGVAPYKFSIASGGGSISASSGTSVTFTAAGAAGSVAIEAIDSANSTAVLILAVGAQSASATTLNVSLSPASVLPTAMTTVSVTGGTAPYTYSTVPANSGSFAGNVFTAPAISGTMAIVATDSNGLMGTASLVIIAVSSGAEYVSPSGTVTQRTCNLATIAANEQSVQGVVDYSYCLSYMRLPLASEQSQVNNYIDQMNNGNMGPIDVAESVYESAMGFTSATYNVANGTGMTDHDAQLALSRRVLFTDPTSYVTFSGAADDFTAYGWWEPGVFYSNAFAAIHVGLATAETKYCNAGGSSSGCGFNFQKVY